MTIPELFQESAERFSAYPALASKNGKKWDTLTFSQYYEMCRKAAKSLIKVSSSLLTQSFRSHVLQSLVWET